MTIYVDDMRRLAVPRGGTRRARWSHMFTDQDDQTELHAFAAQLGLQRSWFQNARWEATHPWRCHYDVTDSTRARALKLGATPITYPRGLAELIYRRKQARAHGEDGAAEQDTAQGDCLCCEVSARLCAGLVAQGSGRCCAECNHGDTPP